MIELEGNVVLDGASTFAWEELNESRFLTLFFQHLRERMGPTFEHFRFYVLNSQDPNAIPESAGVPDDRKVLIFLSDESSSMPTELAKRYFAVFKAYLPNEIRGGNIFPFNLGCVKDVPEVALVPLQERDIDIFFSGNLNSNRLPLYRALHPLFRKVPPKMAHAVLARLSRGRGRLVLADRFRAGSARNHIRFSHGFKSGLAPDQYASLLARSKIALCPRGFQSAETFRHMEAVRAGCVVISEPLPDTHWYRKAPIVTVSDWKVGLSTARLLLRNEATLLELHEQTLRWWKSVCSQAATARYVHKCLCELEANTLIAAQMSAGQN
jgi:hypothetical protein